MGAIATQQVAIYDYEQWHDNATGLTNAIKILGLNSGRNSYSAISK
ncbi:MAG: hypothetical protein MJ238_04910 [Bacilli bacterium]|nr:hypothetical protein [Bacilli bacterium]